MDERLSYTRTRSSSFDSPPILVAAATEPSRRRAAALVAGCGLRLAAAVPIEEALERIRIQGSLSAIWAAFGKADEGRAIALLDRVNEDVLGGLYSAVVEVPIELLDPLAARVCDDVELLVDPTDAERAAALAVAIANRSADLRISDMSADTNSARLRQLSEEVNRIASTLASLSTLSERGSAGRNASRAGPAPSVSVDAIRSIVRARRLRSKYFNEQLFADPAWDMMLDLLQAEASNLRVPVSSLCIAAAVPATTALRWLKGMVQQGYLVRRPDPHDGRRIFVELTPETSEALRAYFAELEGLRPV